MPCTPVARCAGEPPGSPAHPTLLCPVSYAQGRHAFVAYAFVATTKALLFFVVEVFGGFRSFSTPAAARAHRTAARPQACALHQSPGSLSQHGEQRRRAGRPRSLLSPYFTAKPHTCIPVRVCIGMDAPTIESAPAEHTAGGTLPLHRTLGLYPAFDARRAAPGRATRAGPWASRPLEPGLPAATCNSSPRGVRALHLPALRGPNPCRGLAPHAGGRTCAGARVGDGREPSASSFSNPLVIASVDYPGGPRAPRALGRAVCHAMRCHLMPLEKRRTPCRVRRDGGGSRTGSQRLVPTSAALRHPFALGAVGWRPFAAACAAASHGPTQRGAKHPTPVTPGWLWSSCQN